MAPKSPPAFDKTKHVKYWKRCSTLLPYDYQSTDASRISLGFFTVAALDLLGVLETEISQSERQGWIDWIYSCQVPSGGFRGFPGTNLGLYRNLWNMHWDPASLPSTYLALLTLLILGDDLARVRRKECVEWIGRLQKLNGSFGDFEFEEGDVLAKDDLRMCYCAVGTAYILRTGLDQDEKLPFDEEALLRFINNCQGHDGGFGQSPQLEPHSGLNFCAVAALGCLERLKVKGGKEKSIFTTDSLDISHNVVWMLQRQTTWVDEDDNPDEEEDSSDSDVGISSMTHEDPDRDDYPFNPNDGPFSMTRREAREAGLDPPRLPRGMAAGFNGRVCKIADTCYCFWNVGALAILKKESLVDIEALKYYLCGKAQHMIGGFSKAPRAPPDVMHSYLGLATLAVYEEPGLKGLDPVLAVSKEAAKGLEKVAWRNKDDP